MVHLPQCGEVELGTATFTEIPNLSYVGCTMQVNCNHTSRSRLGPLLNYPSLLGPIKLVDEAEDGNIESQWLL